MARSWIVLGAFSGLIACGAPQPSGATAPETNADPRSPKATATGAELPPPAASDAPLPEGTYRVLLTRTDRVGARARVRRVTTDVRSTRTLQQGRQIGDQSSRRRVELDAASEVLEVSADGRATKIRYVVDRLEAATAKGPKAIVPAGTELVVVRKAGTPGELRISSEPLDEDSLDALKAVVPTSMAKITEHQVFGTDTPRRIGDAWPIDTARARAAVAEVGLEAPGTAKGTSRLVEKRSIAGEECLFVLGQLELDRFDLPGLPAGARTQRSKLRMRFTGAYPVELDRPVRRQTLSIAMALTASARKNGRAIEIVIDSTRETNTELDPL